MKEENKIIKFLKKIFIRKNKPYDKYEEIRIKRKMCFEARVAGLCREPHCSYCAWRVDD